MQLVSVCDRTCKNTYRIYSTLIDCVILSRDVVFIGGEETSPKSTDEEPPDLVDYYYSNNDSVDSYAGMSGLLFWQTESD